MISDAQAAILDSVYESNYKKLQHSNGELIDKKNIGILKRRKFILVDLCGEWYISDAGQKALADWKTAKIT